MFNQTPLRKKNLGDLGGQSAEINSVNGSNRPILKQTKNMQMFLMTLASPCIINHDLFILKWMNILKF